MALRLLAFLCALLALAGVALAGIELQKALSGTPLQNRSAIAPGTGPATQPPVPVQNRPDRWPALFGDEIIPEPQPPVQAAAPQPPTPPLSSLGYVLKGTVAQNGKTWAILSHPSGERIVKAGDALNDQLTIDEIDAKGLWVRTARGRELLEFSQ